MFWCLVMLGNADIVKVLLAANASTEVHNEDDLTPLVMAVLIGHNDIMKMLINSGANVDGLTAHSYSALHHAAWSGNIEAVQMLLDNSAHDDDHTDDGNTPLALAAHGGYDYVLELFIHRGCCVNNSDKSVLVICYIYAGHPSCYPTNSITALKALEHETK